MALSRSTLQKDLQDFFKESSESNGSFSSVFCAKRILDIYSDYANNAQDPSGDTPLVVNKASAGGILIPAFEAQKVEEGIIKGLQAFWTGASFRISVPAAGMSQETTSLVTGFSTAPLNGLFIKPYGDYSTAARILSGQLHDFTKTVTVLITGLAVAGSPPPVITVTGTIS